MTIIICSSDNNINNAIIAQCNDNKITVMITATIAIMTTTII